MGDLWLLTAMEDNSKVAEPEDNHTIILKKKKKNLLLNFWDPQGFFLTIMVLIWLIYILTLTLR